MSNRVRFSLQIVLLVVLLAGAVIVVERAIRHQRRESQVAPDPGPAEQSSLRLYCPHCREEFDAVVDFSETPPYECPHCGRRAARVVDSEEATE